MCDCNQSTPANATPGGAPPQPTSPSWSDAPMRENARRQAARLVEHYRAKADALELLMRCIPEELPMLADEALFSMVLASKSRMF